MAWSDKDDAIDWQAYFHLRNRLVVAAMHWDGNIRGLIGSHMKATFKHLLCLEYSTVAIQNKAMDDFLAGPEHIFSILESALPDVRKMREQYPDAVVLPGATALPPPSDKRRKKVKIPTNPLAISVRLSRGVAAPTQAARSRAPPAAADQRRDPGRPVVLAVQGRRRHGHHRRRPRRGLPPARSREDVRAAARVDASPTATRPQVQPHAQGLPRGAARAVQQAEVGNGAPGIVAGHG